MAGWIKIPFSPGLIRAKVTLLCKLGFTRNGGTFPLSWSLTFLSTGIGMITAVEIGNDTVL